jgi:hypothetical protein
MRSDRLALVAALALLGGCALSLDDATDGGAAADGGAPPRPTCPAFADGERGVAATGRLRSFAVDGGAVFVVDRLTPGAGAPAVANAVFEVNAPDATTCLRGGPAGPVAAGLDARALGDGVTTGLLAAFVAGGRRFAFVQVSAPDGFVPVGVALAEWDDAAGLYVADGGYLFTADRPNFGDAALVVGDLVYAYGCRGSGWLTDACYVARAPADRLHDPTAYEFYRSGGDFGPSADDAWPIFDGGAGLAVVQRGARVYALYAPPLGAEIRLRSGLGPTGPWSTEFTMTACELAAKDAFCGGVSAHDVLGGGDESVAVTYAVSSFSALPAGAAASRLVVVPITGLP